jgi:hypothetical protein
MKRRAVTQSTELENSSYIKFKKGVVNFSMHLWFILQCFQCQIYKAVPPNDRMTC